MALLDLILDLIIAGQHTLAKKAWKKPKRLGQNKPSLWGGEKVDQKNKLPSSPCSSFHQIILTLQRVYMHVPHI